jgi:hypothetical protein
VAKTLGATTGLDPVTVDFALKRGVLIRGRVTDKETGRPVPALVEYFAFRDNPHLRETPGLLSDRRANSHGGVRTAKDGSFTLLGLPGRGLVAAKAADRKEEGRYIMALGADQIRGPRKGDSFSTEPHTCDAPQFNTLVAVNPAKDAGSIVCNFVLDPGQTVTGTIVDPDGRPVNGARIDSIGGVWFQVQDLPTAPFRIPGVDPKHPRAFYFRHRGRDLGAAVLLKGDEPMPVTVRLQKCATITGRLVDSDGLPYAGAWIMGYIHKGQLNINNGGFGGGFHGVWTTGKDGRFRIEGVIPGLKVGLWAGKRPSIFDQHLVPELTLKAGEVKDLGDRERKATD